MLISLTKETEKDFAHAIFVLRQLVEAGGGEASLTIHATEGISVTDREGVVTLMSGSPAMTMKAVLALDKRRRRT